MKKKKNKIENNRLGYLMTIPATLLILLVDIYPLFNGISLSLQKYNLQHPDKRRFIGLDNYVDLFQDAEFLGVLGYTFFYTIVTVVASYLFGLILALIMNRKMPGKGIYRTLALLPWAVAPSVANVCWRLLFNDRVGIINIFLMKIGAIDSPILFLAKGDVARYTVIFTDFWRDFPFMMIVLLASMSSIPRDLYESAYMDGAGFWSSFRYITMPMIKGVSAISTILMFIWVFNRFDNIYLLTGGGPNKATYTLPIMSYYTSFMRGNMGKATAMAVVMLMVMTVVALIYLRVMKSEENE